MRRYILFIVGAVFTLTAVTLGSLHWANNETQTEVIASAASNINLQVERKTPDTLVSQVSQRDTPQKKPLKFHAVNGISLLDTKDKVVAKVGEPLEKIEHEFNQDMVNYDYGHMQILFIGDSIQNIAIPASEEAVQIGEQTFPMDQEQIAAILGEPLLEAEDGILYKKDGVYIKVFFKPNSMNMDSVHFFTQGI